MVERKLGRIQQAPKDILVRGLILGCVGDQILQRGQFGVGRVTAEGEDEEFLNDLRRGGARIDERFHPVAQACMHGVANGQMEGL